MLRLKSLGELVTFTLASSMLQRAQVQRYLMFPHLNRQKLMFEKNDKLIIKQHSGESKFERRRYLSKSVSIIHDSMDSQINESYFTVDNMLSISN